jgi:hypothetical protein
VVGSCERGDEHSSSIKCNEFLHYVRHQQLVKKHPAPCSSLAAIALNPNNLLKSLSHRASLTVTSHTTHNILLNSRNILRNMSISTTGLLVCAPGIPLFGRFCSAEHHKFSFGFCNQSPPPPNLIRFADMAHALLRFGPLEPASWHYFVQVTCKTVEALQAICDGRQLTPADVAYDRHAIIAANVSVATFHIEFQSSTLRIRCTLKQTKSLSKVAMVTVLRLPWQFKNRSCINSLQQRETEWGPGQAIFETVQRLVWA